jgi:DNA-binding beta-propeller fold protein YncE
MPPRLTPLLVLGAIIAAGCDTTSPQVPTWLTTSPPSAILVRGDSVRLEVRVLAADSAPLPAVPVAFSSSDTVVTTVSATGVVRGVNVGSATVTVRGGDLTQMVPIAVIPQPAGLELTPRDTTLRKGESVQLIATAYDSASAPIPGVTVLFQSDAPTVVSVSTGGVAIAVAAAGSALVTAGAGSLSATATVRAVDSAIVARIKLPGPAYGATASGIGTAFVTLPYGRHVARLDLDALSLSGLIEVGAAPASLALNPARTRLYVSIQSARTISVVDVSTGVMVDTFRVTGDPVPLQVSADGNALFVATDAHRLYRIDVVTGTAVDSLDLPSTSHCMEFNAGRDRLYVATRVAGTAIEVDPAAMTALRTFQVGGFTQGLVVTADGSQLWVGNGSGGVDVWSLGTGTRLAAVPTGALSGVFGLTVDDGDIRLYATIPADGKVLVIDRVGRAVVRTLVTGGIPRQVAFDAATGYVVVANESGWVDVLR